MKIHIMTDMEGCAGIVETRDYVYTDSKYYEYACELATLEASAAVEGALEAGATEVLVVDGHGPGAMKRHLLHPRAKLLAGRPWSGGCTFGCDGSFAASIIVGQHAMSNTDGGHLCHTMAFAVEEYVMNGRPVGEIGLWMLVAGYFGVPVVMVSGDEAACEEARDLVANIELAPVKWGHKRGSAAGLPPPENKVFNSVATHLHPDAARVLVRERAYRAVRRIPEIAPFRLDPPYKLTIQMRPEKPGGKGVKTTFKAGDLLDLFAQRRKGKPSRSKKKQAKPAPKAKAAPKTKAFAKTKAAARTKLATKTKAAVKTKPMVKTKAAVKTNTRRKRASRR